jgi:hypothetical protein
MDFFDMSATIFARANKIGGFRSWVPETFKCCTACRGV